MTEHPFTSWLRSALAEAEGVANEVRQSPYDPGDEGLWVYDDDYWHNTLAVTQWAVLSLVERDRKLLEIHTPHQRKNTCRTCDPEGHTGFVLHPCPTLRLVGEFWSRLYPSGYNEGWRPE